MNVKRIGLILLLIVLVAVVVFAETRSTGRDGITVTASNSTGSWRYHVQNNNERAISIEIAFDCNLRLPRGQSTTRTIQLVIGPKSAAADSLPYPGTINTVTNVRIVTFNFI